MDHRIEEIIKSLTLEEKASMLSGGDYWLTREMPEKGVPVMMMADGPHGLRKQEAEVDMLGINESVPATCFPSAACICNSWDETLIQKIGEAIGEECQAEQIGLLLGPGNNIKRSPLCGRNFEYFSEDPYLSGKMAAGHIKGVQNKGVGTSLKHFAANSQETYRMSVDSVVDERTLREIYLTGFEIAVKEGKPWTIMGAYNRINGNFCCENYHLLQEILRDEWGFDGVVISDWGGVNDQVAATGRGFDLRMPYLNEEESEKIVKAVKKGQLEESSVNTALGRILKMILTAEDNKRTDVTVDKEKHHLLAETAAADSMVLLKNDNQVLPLKKEDKVAFIGPFAEHMRYQGGGSSHINATFLHTVPQVLKIRNVINEWSYAEGFPLNREENDDAMEEEALKMAERSDKIVLFLGLPDGWESEGFDRKQMSLPDNQNKLFEKLAETGKPVTVIIFSGAPVELPWIEKAAGLIAAYTAGQAVSEALVDILTGTVNPSGKLAETWPVKQMDVPCALNYPQKKTAVYEEGIYVGYRYYEKKQMPVCFPFGCGISYTEFVYSNLQVEKDDFVDTEKVIVSVDVENIGKRSGKEIVQLYVSEKRPEVSRPVMELKGFSKVPLAAGEKKTVTFVMDKRSFAYYQIELGDWYVKSGEFDLLIGASSKDIRLRKTVHVTGSIEKNMKFTLFSTMEELLENPKSARILQQFMQPAGDQTSDSSEVETKKNDVKTGMEMGMTMPLIRLSEMSRGFISVEAMQQLIDAANQAIGV